MVSGLVAGITNQPLVPKVTIQNSIGGGVYTFDPTVPTTDFIVKQLSFTPPSDYGVAGDFDLIIGSWTDANFLKNVQLYGEVTIWVGKQSVGLTKLFLGSIDTFEVQEPNQNQSHLHISGPDWGSQVLKNRIINHGWYQLKNAGSQTPDNSDLSTRVGTLVYNILTQTNVYPSAIAPTCVGQGMIVNKSNILNNTDGGLSLPFFEANFEYVDDKISDLDSYVNATHYVDATKTFFQKFLPLDQSLIPDSGILITDDYNDSVASTWASGSIGLLLPDSKYAITSEMHKANIYGLGGNNVTIDQSQQNVAGTSDDVHAQFLAVKFTPTVANLDSISAYITKVGTATNPTDCVLSVVYDSSNTPNGQTIASPTISTDSFGLSESNHWHTAQAGAALVIGSPFWIILNKQGADASHTYQWTKGNNGGQTIATSTDGITWTVTSATNGYAFETWTNSPLLTAAYNFTDGNVNFAKNGFAESVVRKPFINRYDQMNWLLAQETYTLFRYKETLTGHIFAPDVLLLPMQKVRIRKQLSKYTLDANYVLGTITYNFQGDEEGQIGNFHYDIAGTLYSSKSVAQTTGAS